MRKVSEYTAHAEECRRMASQMQNPKHKKQLAQMAETWEMLAKARAKELELQGNEPPQPSRVICLAIENAPSVSLCRSWLGGGRGHDRARSSCRGPGYHRESARHSLHDHVSKITGLAKPYREAGMDPGR